MKLDFSEIIIESHDNHSVTGELQGLKIVVSRTLEGWTPQLNITLNGLLVHCCTASEDKKEYTKLRERAMNERCERQEIERDNVIKSKAFESLFK